MTDSGDCALAPTYLLCLLPYDTRWLRQDLRRELLDGRSKMEEGLGWVRCCGLQLVDNECSPRIGAMHPSILRSTEESRAPPLLRPQTPTLVAAPILSQYPLRSGETAWILTQLPVTTHPLACSARYHVRGSMHPTDTTD